MVAQTTPPQVSPKTLDRAAAYMKKGAWQKIVDLADGLPFDGHGPAGELFEEVCFALTQLDRLGEAIELADALVAAKPLRKRLSSAAYARYLALIGHKPVKGTPTAKLKDELLAALQAHIDADAQPVTPLYRRGNFFAQVQSGQDKRALADFEAAIACWEAMSPAQQQRRHALRKNYIKSLYAGARSAMRLRQLAKARRLIGRCLRLDQKSNFMAPVFKLYLAAVILDELGEQERARRGLLLAADAKGPRQRAFVHHRLAKILARGDDLDGALAWLDKHVPPRRRPPFCWNLAADLYRAKGMLDHALRALESALFKERSQRHITLAKLGELHLERGNPGKAKHSFEQALQFRRKKHGVTCQRSLRGLLEVARQRGDEAEFERLQERLRAARRDSGGERRGRPDRQRPPKAAGGGAHAG